MKLSLLAIAVLAVALVGLVKADDSLLGAGAEIELVEEEPQQNDEEVQDEVEEAVQDEPISEPDASDDDASLDEPEDASADDYDSSEEVSDEPTAELDPTEEPTVPSEEEGEGFEGAEELHADDGINYDEEFRADDDGELEWADDNGTEEEEEVGEEEGEEGEEGGEEEVGEEEDVGEEEEGGDDDEVYVEHAEVREKRATTKKAPPKTTKKPTPKTTKKPTVKTTKKPVVQTTKKPATTNPPPHPSPFVAWNDKIRCTGPQLRGPCNKNIKRWHYNAVTNQCSPFEYSGCGGNDNNWIYLGNCQKVCVKKPPPTPKPKPTPALKWNDKKRCQGPVVAGPCKAAVKRYHYNAAKDTCETFTWGGCQPVPNNWVYIKNCQKVCVTKKKPAPVKWNDPRRCVGEKIRGNCKSDLKRYHYNAATDKCELFSYSGCGGNINNWQYIKNCQKICVKNKPTPPAKLNWDDKRRCDGPVVRGPCKKEIRRFHYDATRDQCLPFVYGGCEGNHNNWVYRKNCQKICKVKKLAWDDPNRCKGPEIRGPCNKNIRRYHYDAALDKCVPFSYGGCAGNDNNWWYIKNCQRICVKKNEPDTPPKPVWNDPIRCQGSVEVGTCDKSIRRYHYNPDTNKCEPFQYSGCGGNNNNWWYINNCRKVCVKPDSDDDGHEGGGGDGGDVPSGGDNPSGVDQDDTGSGSVPVPDGGFGGLGFVEAPTECSSGDGSISIKVPKACPLVLCSKRCKYGFVADASGCPTCYCSRPACDELQSLLTGR